MSQLLILNLKVSTINALKKLAEQHNRSLQAEIKLILEAAGRSVEFDPAKFAAKIRQKLSAKSQSDSAKLVSKDRNR